MKKLIVVISLAIITCWSGFVIPTFSQDAQFVQFFASPLYFNPANAGADSGARLAFNFRNQWPEFYYHSIFMNQFYTYNLEFDKHIEALHGGIGLMAWKDEAGSGTFANSDVSLLYSYQMNVTKDFTLHAGIQASYLTESVDWSKLTFGDMVNPRIGSIVDPNANLANPRYSCFDFSAGIVGYAKEFFGGISAAHFTQPSEYNVTLHSRLPMKLTGNLGAMIPLDSGGKTTTYLSPNILFLLQDNFHQMNVGLYIQRGWLVGGLWYRFDDSFVATLGVQIGGFKIGYSYDQTLSKLSDVSGGGAHEISLGYRFGYNPKSDGFHSINCPAF